jgi:hypothetical protein
MQFFEELMAKGQGVERLRNVLDNSDWTRDEKFPDFLIIVLLLFEKKEILWL